MRAERPLEAPEGPAYGQASAIGLTAPRLVGDVEPYRRVTQRETVMFRRLTGSGGDVLGYAVEGEVTTQDVAAMQADIETAIHDHDSVRVLLDLEGLEQVEPSAVWQDLKMLREYVGSLERVAIVGDERWHEWSAVASELVADARFFEPHHSERAWAWVRNDERR